MIILGRRVVDPSNPTTPVTPPGVVARKTRRRGLGLVLTGADGSTWDLINGPVRLQPGVQGLVPGGVVHRWVESPIVSGAVHRGHRVPPQAVVLPVIIAAGSALGMRDLDAAFWRAVSPEAECYITVTSPDAVARTMGVWFEGADVPLDRDPLVMGNQAYPLAFTAGHPFWRGERVSQVFAPLEDPPPFFAEPGSGAVFNFISARTTKDSRVRNEGDVPVLPIYSMTGPVSSASVTVGDNAVSYGPIEAGQTVWIDTSPTMQTVGYARGGNDEAAWLGLTSRDFAPIPAGETVPIDVELIGAGPGAQLAVELAPDYRRPY